MWLIGTGKLAAFVNALRSAPEKAPAPGGDPSPLRDVHPLIGGQEPTLDGKTNAISGALLDPKNPVLRIGPLSGGEFT